jgi:RHS repeat-associated protein
VHLQEAGTREPATAFYSRKGEICDVVTKGQILRLSPARGCAADPALLGQLIGSRLGLPTAAIAALKLVPAICNRRVAGGQLGASRTAAPNERRLQVAGTGLWREPTFLPSFRDFSPETGTGRVRCPQRAAEVSWRPGGRRRGEDTPPYQPQTHGEERCEIAGARFRWQPVREHMNPVRLARLGMVWIGLWLTALLPLLTTATHAEHSFKPAATPAYLYTGEQIDPDLGMYYLRARYYQPSIGRFWNMDSYEGGIEQPLSLQKFLYCHGNPVNGVDPSGHDFSCISVGGSMGIVGQLGSFELKGAHAALVGGRAMFGADAQINDLIAGMNYAMLVEEKVGQVALGVGAVAGGVWLYNVMKDTGVSSAVAKAVLNSIGKVSKLFPTRAPKPINPASSPYLYRVIQPGSRDYANFLSANAVGSVSPRGQGNDVMKHLLNMNDYDSVFTSWSKSESGNWARWGTSPGSIQLRIDTRTLKNVGLDATDLAGSDEFLVIGQVLGVERVR